MNTLGNYRSHLLTPEQQTDLESKSTPVIQKWNPSMLRKFIETRSDAEIEAIVEEKDGRFLSRLPTTWIEVPYEYMNQLPVGTWLYQVKFKNFKTKENRVYESVIVTYQQPNSIGIARRKQSSHDDSKYPWKHQEWSFSWNDNGKTMEEALKGGHHWRRFYINHRS